MDVYQISCDLKPGVPGSSGNEFGSGGGKKKKSIDGAKGGQVPGGPGAPAAPNPEMKGFNPEMKGFNPGQAPNGLPPEPKAKGPKGGV